MTERNPDGGYAGITDWTGRDVPAMWRMLADQRTDAHWRQVNGWRKTYQLAEAHLARLRGYRAELARSWPPDRNAAARAYLDRLDQLISSVAETHEVASANYTTVAAATGAIDAARADLAKIHSEYAAKQQIRDRFEQQSAALASAGYQPWRKPPVSDAELEELNVRGRAVLAGLSNELVQAQAQIRQPTPYVRPPTNDRSDSDIYGTSGPPPLPSIVPVPSGGSSASTSSGNRLGRTPAVGHFSPALAEPASGPVLNGIGTPTPDAPVIPAPDVSPVGPHPSRIIAALDGGPQVPPLSGLPAVSGRTEPGAPTPPSSRTPLPGEAEGVSRPATQPLARALPPGGVIGGAPPALGHMTPSTQTRRINPVGGMLSGGGAGTTPAGRAGSRPLGPVSRPVFSGLPEALSASWPGYPASTPANRADPAWEPDRSWKTNPGVPPVMLPPAEPGPIDPGPAIGLDR